MRSTHRVLNGATSAIIGGVPAYRPNATAMPRYTPLVASLPSTVPFVGPETQERQRSRPFKARLGANENGFGPSPRAVSAMAAAAAEAWCYGDPEVYDLKQQLASHHGVEPSNICVGEGIDGLLGYLVRLVVSEGTPVVTSAGAYPTLCVTIHPCPVADQASHCMGCLLQQLPRSWLWGQATTRTVPRGWRRPRRCARNGTPGGCRAVVLLQSEQSNGKLSFRSDDRAHDLGRAGWRIAMPG